MDFSTDWPMRLLVLAPPLLFSLTIHEFAHARTALAFGDPTAKRMGRVTLNPLAHLDPIGTIALLVSNCIGWAKPVPVNPANLHPPRLGDLAVSLAGPLSNLLLAIASAGALRLWLHLSPSEGGTVHGTVTAMLLYTIVANVGLCVFNMIPLFPLDGHHVARELVSPAQRQPFMAWQIRYGPILLGAIIIGPRLYETLVRKPLPFDPLGYVVSQLADVVLKVVGFGQTG